MTFESYTSHAVNFDTCPWATGTDHYLTQCPMNSGHLSYMIIVFRVDQALQDAFDTVPGFYRGTALTDYGTLPHQER